VARYIDAEAVDFSPLKDDFERARAKVIIMGQPTADVVKVVRCKDCRMFVENKKAFVAYCKRELKNLCVKPDDYCSYGEMKEVQKNDR
jgi:hypothetical protein